jgi:hypothetical protein
MDPRQREAAENAGTHSYAKMIARTAHVTLAYFGCRLHSQTNMTLEQHIEDIRAGVKAGRYTNEASVSQGIVLRLLQALGWPTYDT